MIEVKDLRFTYESVEALRGISFQVRPGEICGYLGPNGAGKSTTVKALVGILHPRVGSLRICGFDVSEHPIEAKRQIGYVPENAAAFTLLTAREYLQLVGDLYEVPEDTLHERINKLLKNLDLGDCADRRIDTFSKGQRQKTALAAALVHDPQVLILDEPLTGLDANAARTIKDLLIAMAAQQRTVLCCSHVLEVVERICHRVVVLNKGEIVADGPTSELLGLSKARNLEAVFHQLTMSGDDGDRARQLLAALGPGTRSGAQPPAPEQAPSPAKAKSKKR